jgi:hypothetical protein
LLQALINPFICQIKAIQIKWEIKSRMITLQKKYLWEHQDAGKGILKVMQTLTSLIH